MIPLFKIMSSNLFPFPKIFSKQNRLFLVDRPAAKVNVWFLAEAAAVFCIFVIGLAMVQYATAALIGTDGYYHVKIGYLMRTGLIESGSLRPTFDQLPFTILNEAAYYDHHYLYHAWLALFAWGNPLVDGGIALTQGAKLASVLMPAIAFTAVWWLLKNQKIPFPIFWSISLLILSEPFLYRMSMPRAQSMSLLLLVLAVHWLLQKKYSWLAALGFIFVWSYNAFPLLLVVVGVYIIATLLTEQKLAWQPFAWAAAGIVLGLIINPYFPQNISFIIDHLAPKLGDSTTKVGNEWGAYRTITLIENSPYTFIFLLLGIFAIGWQKERIDKRTLFMLGLAVLFGAMLFESRRFIEYFPPFVLLFAAFAAAPIIHQFLEQWGNRRHWLKPSLGVLAICILAAPLQQTLTDAAELTADSKPADRYAEASLWLHEHAGSDIQIFQTDWDDFTRLFFYNSKAKYTAGLDPTFMELHDKELFDSWVAITRGRVENPGSIILNQFAADYVFSDLKHSTFEKQAQNDPMLKEIYRDRYAVIYAVSDKN